MYNDYTCEKFHEAKQRDFMEEAAGARLLKQAGARRVALLTVARVDRRVEGWRLTAQSMVKGKV